MQHLQQQLSTARESHGMQQRMLQDANGTWYLIEVEIVLKVVRSRGG
jgi:hypothetical protein